MIGWLPDAAPDPEHVSQATGARTSTGCFDPEDRLLEGEVDHELEVGAPRRARRAAATPAEGTASAEERLEDVVDPAACAAETERIAARAPTPSGPKRS